MGVMFMNLDMIAIRGNSSFSDMVNYYARDTAVDNTPLETEPLEMLDYYSRFDTDTVCTGFDDMGDKTVSKALEEFELYQPKEVLRCIISFKKDDAIKLGFVEKNDYALLASKFVSECGRQQQIKHENLIWTGYLHKNTDNPHVHLYFFDKSKVNQNLFTRSQLKVLRSKLANSIIQNHQEYVEKEEIKKSLFEEIKLLLSEPLIEDHIQARLFEGISLRRLSKENRQLVSLLQGCADEIPSKGRTQMAVLEKYYPEAYGSVMRVVDYLMENNSYFPTFQEKLIDIEPKLFTLYGSQSQAFEYLQNQIDSLKHSIGNHVIRVVKEHRTLLKKGVKNSLTLAKSLSDLSSSCFFLMNKSIMSLGNGYHSSAERRELEEEEKSYEI